MVTRRGDELVLSLKQVQRQMDSEYLDGVLFEDTDGGFNFPFRGGTPDPDPLTSALSPSGDSPGLLPRRRSVDFSTYVDTLMAAEAEETSLNEHFKAQDEVRAETVELASPLIHDLRDEMPLRAFPFAVDLSIPPIQFGEKRITPEIVHCSLLLNEAVQMRRKYFPFRYPWEEDMTQLDPLPPFEGYDGSIQIHDQEDSNEVLRMVSGCIHVLPSGSETEGGGEEEDGESTVEPLFQPRISFAEHVRDFKRLSLIVKDPPSKSYCFSRLRLLERKFDLFKDLYSTAEHQEMKRVSHKDFYNARKVDNHLHLSSCMNQKKLLIFIREKLELSGEEVVMTNEEGEGVTLAEVFAELGLTHDSVSVDSLDVQVRTGEFHRFDLFNSRFSPFGMAKLRSIFLKVDNEIRGSYFGSLIHDVFSELDRYTLIEPRISIYGRNPNELKTIAHWVEENHLFHPNVKWVIQVPRLFDRMEGTFEEMLSNIFLPFFEATRNPHADPIVSNFIQNYVVGFDSVDDESKPDNPFYAEMKPPETYGMRRRKNPPYAYYSYYFWANINTLNAYRKSKGMSTFQYRPHSGEVGDISHLMSTFLLADQIAHGIQLRKTPVLTYLYFLCQIGLSMSPISNNKLFLTYQKSPFPKFFKVGLNVALSTDDPLMFHFTREPLMEEYSVAQQIWNLSPADLCEIARRSILQSGWPHGTKQEWVSRYYDRFGAWSNNIEKTNVPNLRIQFRHETLMEEHLFIQSVLHRAHMYTDVDPDSILCDAVSISRRHLLRKCRMLRAGMAGKSMISLFANENATAIDTWNVDHEDNRTASAHRDVERLNSQIEHLRETMSRLQRQRRLLKLQGVEVERIVRQKIVERQHKRRLSDPVHPTEL